VPPSRREDLTKTNIPDPTSTWISITGTYDTITAKLNDGSGSKADRLAAIDYWMKRLQEDRASIASGGNAHTH
jgi:hypothetical protein